MLKQHESCWRRVLLLGLLPLSFLFVGCETAGQQAEDALERYFVAVQEQDLKALRCLIDPNLVEPESATMTERVTGEDWVRLYLEAQLEVYERGKELEFVPLEQDPVRMVKLFSLGRGAFYTVSRSEGDSLELQLTTEIRLGYSHLDLSRFTPGTTLFLGGAPAGKVETIIVPRFSSEVSVSVLDRIDVEWQMVVASADEVCPQGWRVMGADPIEGSEQITATTWKF